jgi:hypothetical protein
LTIGTASRGDGNSGTFATGVSTTAAGVEDTTVASSSLAAPTADYSWLTSVASIVAVDLRAPLCLGLFKRELLVVRLGCSGRGGDPERGCSGCPGPDSSGSTRNRCSSASKTAGLPLEKLGPLEFLGSGGHFGSRRCLYSTSIHPRRHRHDYGCPDRRRHLDHVPAGRRHRGHVLLRSRQQGVDAFNGGRDWGLDRRRGYVRLGGCSPLPRPSRRLLTPAEASPS